MRKQTLEEAVRSVLNENSHSKLEFDMRDALENVVDMSRKPDNWDENFKKISMNKIKQLETRIGYTLKSFDHKEIYSNGLGSINDKFSIEVPLIFILRFYARKWIINTEGYDYARYVAEIKG